MPKMMYKVDNTLVLLRLSWNYGQMATLIITFLEKG
jgi:hypothetical protein